MPSRKAAPTRYHDKAIIGPRRCSIKPRLPGLKRAVRAAASIAYCRRSRARAQSRCINISENAPKANTMMKLSSRPVRLITMPRPSNDMSRPAISAIGRLWNRRKATRVISTMATTPAMATLARQATGLSAPPNSFSPAAIIHLPTGGCTTYSAVLSQRSVSPAANSRSISTSTPSMVTSFGQSRASPVFSMVHASLT